MLHLLMQTSYGGPGGGAGGPGGGGAAPVWAGIVGLLFFLAIFAAIVALWGMIFKKAGYSFWTGLLMIIPLVNLIWLLVFAFSQWPIHRELERYRQQVGYAGGGFPVGSSMPMPPPPPVAPR